MVRSRGRFSRLFSLLALFLVTGTVPAVPSLAATSEAAESIELEPGELTSRRTGTSRTFRNEDGSLTTTAFAGPVNFLDASGKWHPINSNLVPAQEPGYAWQNGANTFELLFKERLGQGFLRVDAKGRSFAVGLEGAASVKGEVDGPRIRYRNAFGGVDAEYEVGPEGLKETLVLHTPDVPLKYRFLLSGDEQLEAISQDDGSWAFFSSGEPEPIFTLDPPYAVEASDAAASEASRSGTATDDSSHATLEVTEIDGGFAVDLGIDATWLQDPDRRFPVLLDPSVTIEPTQQDATFQADCPTCSGTPGPRLSVGTGSPPCSPLECPLLAEAANSGAESGVTVEVPHPVYRAGLLFDLGTVPTNAEVTDASLQLFHDGQCIATVNGSSGCSGSIGVHRILTPWTESSKTAQVEFDPSTLSSASFGAASQWSTWDVTATAQAWLSGLQPNFGLLLKRSTEPASASGPQFPGGRFTSEPSFRPKLSITYTTDGVQLKTPSTLHSNGAELEWAPYAAAAPFERYEVHRSSTEGFTPSDQTLLATVDDPSVTSYRDTTAAPSKTFTYKVVANSTPSNEQTVTLPADGQATAFLQPDSEGKQTYLNYSSVMTNCGNYGAVDGMWVGTDTTAKYRSLLQFDLSDVPAEATMSSAKLSLWHPGTVGSQITVDAHEVTSEWDEGTGLGTCTVDGATWYERRGEDNWDAEGGDYNVTPAASITNLAGEKPAWDHLDIAALAQKWVSGEAPNLGVILKGNADGSLSAGRNFRYYSDDSSASPWFRPKLVLSYADDSHGEGPAVSVNSPMQGSRVSGADVVLSAAASDDRRVEKVEFLVDGQVVGSSSSDPFTATWNSLTVADGSHTISARGTDDAGNTSTSDGVAVTVANTGPPATTIITPTPGSAVQGMVTVQATAKADPRTTIEKVEFFADGRRFSTVSTPNPPLSNDLPVYQTLWQTRDQVHPAYDGPHILTVRAYDATGAATTSAPVPVVVANTAGTIYQAAIIPAASNVPQTMVFDPSAPTQQSYPVDVTVTNLSPSTWASGEIFLTYSWINPADNGVVVDGVSSGSALSVNGLLAGESQTLQASILPPPLPEGTGRSQFILRFDLFDTGAGDIIPDLNCPLPPQCIALASEASESSSAESQSSSPRSFSSQGNHPSDNPVVVNHVLMSSALGLERYYGYQQEDVGAGMTHLLNVANGNSLLSWRPWSQPGKGLWTVLSVSYNSLEDRTESPLGNNFSMSISSLSRFGLPLDVHPNNADQIAGRSNKYIELVDADGTLLHFEGNAAGTVYKEPPGVHLFLRRFSITDPTKKWALTRPDGVTFFYDTEGYPTEVRDHNGNRLRFTLEDVQPADDPGGLRKRITRVTDEAGLAASPAPNRSFDITYFTKDDAPSSHVRGKVRRITDHLGHALEFTYYEDGNLLRITEKGGKKADGSVLADRSFVFTYTTSDGSGPAIANASDRVNPKPKTANQSTRLYSVRDPRGKETTFTYITSGQDKWKLLRRTNRRGFNTSFAYDITNRVTTVTEPLSRVTNYAYDTIGEVTRVTNPMNQATDLTWTQDRQVQRATEPTGKYTEFTYNANGYLLTERDQLGNTTELMYQNDEVDSDAVGSEDTASNWTTRRQIPHLSLLIKLTKPMGVNTSTPADDFQWQFEYKNRNLWKVIQPRADDGNRYLTRYEHHPDGSVKEMHDAAGNPPTILQYDANGLVNRVEEPRWVEGIQQVTTFGYDSAGQLLWIQDPNHQQYSGGNPRTYRTYFDYDAFHRLGRQSTPKSTARRDPLIWTSTEYDPNDNVVLQTDAAYGAQFVVGPKSTFTYNDMDQLTEAVNPGSSAVQKTQAVYDDAGRLSRLTRPNGVDTSATDKDFVTDFAYDPLDRAVKETRYLVTGSGTLQDTLRNLFCFDLAGDLTRVVSPKAALDTGTVNCTAAAPQPFTTIYDYDDAHKRLSVMDGEGHIESVVYDANDRVKTSTDASGDSTTYEYDQRDSLIKVIEPYDNGATPARTITTKYVYDGVGNATQVISPRAWDAAGGGPNFTNYVTKYQYNDVNQLTRIDLPKNGSTIQAYVHRDYDLNGNLKTVTLPVTTADLGSVADADMTDLTYLDPGWILTSHDHVNPKVHFDYDARGLQTLRVPEVKAGRKLDTARKLTWQYYPNRLLKSVKDAEGNRETYTYDLNDNLMTAKDSIGVNTSDQSPMSIAVDPYDSLDRVTKVKFKKAADSTWKSTLYTYDKNSNVATRVVNATEGQSGTGITHTFTYDEADWLSTQIDDDGSPSSPGDDQKITNLWWPTGREQRRTVSRYSSGWVAKQTTEWDWFDNGVLKSLTTKRGGTGATVAESHVLDYLEDGIYINGNRTRDKYTLDTQGTGDQCPVEGAVCVAKYIYDARDRLRRYEDGHGGTTTYDLDVIGNVKEENRSGEVTRFTYQGAQLQTKTDPSGSVHNYFYDTLGNLDCIMTSGFSGCPGGSSKSGLEADYKYDSLSRLRSFAAYAAGTKTDSAAYTYDALDRLVKEVETHPGTTPRTTTFTHLGLSNLATQEVHKNTSTGAAITTKSYSYDAYGHRISMTDSAESKTFTYGYDVHGSVSLLINTTATDSSTRASYGYDPYGNKDDTLTKGDISQTNPFNPYRYSAMRFDSGSQTVDMGARRFGTGAMRFLQQDRFMGALDDLSLTMDPLTTNRYALAGGNPVSYMEWDGHVPKRNGFGMAANGKWVNTTRPPKTTPPPPNHQLEKVMNVGVNPTSGLPADRSQMEPDTTNVCTETGDGSGASAFMAALCNASVAIQQQTSTGDVFFAVVPLPFFAPLENESDLGADRYLDDYARRGTPTFRSKAAVYEAGGAADDIGEAADDVAVIGRGEDTAVAKDWPGHEVLEIDDWTLAKNDAWVESVIERRMKVYVASPTTKENLWDSVNNRPRPFARELEQFFDAGYRRKGDYLLPP